MSFGGVFIPALMVATFRSLNIDAARDNIEILFGDAPKRQQIADDGF